MSVFPVGADRPRGPGVRPRAGWRIGPVGMPLRRRTIMAVVMLGAGLLGLFAWSVFGGTLALGADRVWAALLGDGSRVEQLVVDRRLVRSLAAVLVGAALGLAGALTQSVTRNPIATPDILGVTAGASAFAVFAVTNPGLVNEFAGGRAALLVPLLSVIGGVLTTALVLALAWRGGFEGLRLILVGIGVNALALAVVAWLLTRAEVIEVAVATRWLVGSLAGASADDLTLLAPVVLAAAVVCTVLHRDLSAVRLGPDVATGLGTRPGRTGLLSLVVAVAAVCAATAVAGPVGFVAFVAPQAAMRLCGTPGPPPVAGALCGAALLLAADLVGQRLPAPLPAGVITAVIGAPALLYLLTHHVRRSSV